MVSGFGENLLHAFFLRGEFVIYEYNKPILLVWIDCLQNTKTLSQELINTLMEIIKGHKPIEMR